MLREAGYRCITVGASGLATARDDAVSVFGDNLGAIVLTHDREFIARRRENTFGRHVLLACLEWDAADLLKENLDQVLELAFSREAIVIRLSKEGASAYPTKWL